MWYLYIYTCLSKTRTSIDTTTEPITAIRTKAYLDLPGSLPAQLGPSCLRQSIPSRLQSTPSHSRLHVTPDWLYTRSTRLAHRHRQHLARTEPQSIPSRFQMITAASVTVDSEPPTTPCRSRLALHHQPLFARTEPQSISSRSRSVFPGFNGYQLVIKIPDPLAWRTATASSSPEPNLSRSRAASK